MFLKKLENKVEYCHPEKMNSYEHSHSRQSKGQC